MTLTRALLDHSHAFQTTLPSWRIFDTFRIPIPQVPDWTNANSLISKHIALKQEDVVQLIAEFEEWNTKLNYCGGDPAADNWLNFRPLRTKREEDWSDWLQHLICTSNSTRLLTTLLGSAWRGLKVDIQRERPIDDRRTDLVVLGPSNNRAQIEVKVGDRSFKKTIDTALLLEKETPTQWTHILLVPAWDAAQAYADTSGEIPRITVRTWEEVAVSIRASLWRCEEPVNWCVWARAFCGIIEQKLLGLPCIQVHIVPSSAGKMASTLQKARHFAEETHE